MLEVDDRILFLEGFERSLEHISILVWQTHHSTKLDWRVVTSLQARHTPDDFENCRGMRRQGDLVTACEEIEYDSHHCDYGFRMESHLRFLENGPLDFLLFWSAAGREKMVESQKQRSELTLSSGPRHIG